MNHILRALILGVLTCYLSSPAFAAKSDTVHMGKASWYCVKCNGGTHTASGETLRDNALTAAHKALPMGTRVRVTNQNNGKSVIVRINDRGPYIKGRIIDVTKGVARMLDFVEEGVAPVKLEIL